MMTRFNLVRSLMVGAALAAAALLVPAAQAQTYPDRPIHVIVGFPAGAGADILSRYYAHKLEEISKQPVIVDNKPGANANIAVRFVANAKPDGYTILFIANSNMAGSRFLFKELPFDTLTDFIPTATFAEIAFTLVVSPNSKINTIAELIAKLKSKKDNLFGYSNQVGLLSGELFKQLAGVEAKGVAYKNGPDTMRDVTDETLDYTILDGTFAAGQVRQGALKALAVTTSTRSPTFPGVPTMIESGIADFNFVPWWCAYVPKGTPQAVIDQIAAYMHEINKMPETAKFLETVGSLPLDLGQKDADARLRAELPRWEKLVKAAGIEPQ